MDYPLWGILTLLLSLGVYILSAFYQQKDKYICAVSLLMVGGFILRLFTACDFYLHPWDEAFHALVAKHMMQHPFTPTLYEHPALPYDYRNWAGNHIWLHKQPLPLWSMALSMSLFGINELALRLPSLILTTIGIALTYYIASYFYDHRTGYLSAFFYSVNGLIIEMAAGRVATDHIDVFFLFFIELAIFCTILFARRQGTIYNIAAGISMGAAVLCKWLPALIVLPIWLVVIVDSRKFTVKQIAFQFSLLLLFITIVFLPWQLYIYSTFPLEAQSEASHNLRHITEILDEQGGPFYYYLDKIRINYGELIYLPMIWLIWKVWHTRRLKSAALIVWIIVPIVFFSCLKTKMQGYILFCSPAFFIATAAFFFLLKDYTSNEALKPAYKYGLFLILLLFILLPSRYAFERIKPFQKGRSPDWVSTLKNHPDRYQADIILLNYPNEIACMYYTNWTVYNFIPSSNQIEFLLSSGRKIVINDKGDIPENIRHIHGVNFERL